VQDRKGKKVGKKGVLKVVARQQGGVPWAEKLKYRPKFLERFGCIDNACDFCDLIFNWYNHEHYHSSLALLSSGRIGYGQSEAVLARYRDILKAAYAQHPERLVRRAPQPANLSKAV